MKTILFLMLLSSSAMAAQSQATIGLTFVVPVVCTLEVDHPKCNLELKQRDAQTWVDLDRGYIVTIINGILKVESAE